MQRKISFIHYSHSRTVWTDFTGLKLQNLYSYIIFSSSSNLMKTFDVNLQDVDLSPLGSSALASPLEHLHLQRGFMGW